MNTRRSFGYKPQLDGLRAIAVGGVVAFHLGLPQIHGGFTGVDVFFVLSGYLITALVWPNFVAREFSFADFYVRRARRLLPPLFVVFAICAALSFLLLSPDHYTSFARSAIHATLSVSNVNFWLESGYFDSAKYTKPLLHTWSLGVEEQFYLFWPLFLLLLAYMASSVARWSTIIFLLALSFLGGLLLIDSYPSAIFYLSPFRAWQFAAGGVLALLMHGDTPGAQKLNLPGPVAALVTLSGLVMICASFVTVTAEGYPGLKALVPTAGTLLAILGGNNALASSLLSNKVAVFIGRISYSLYLTHWPVIVFIRYYNGDAPLTPMLMLIALALSVGSAYLLFRLIETPLRRPWSASATYERFVVPTFLAGPALLLVVFSIYPWAQSGWSWRLSPEAQNIVAEMASHSEVKCYQRQVKGLGKQCFFGARRNKPDLVLLGDSHANALSNGFDELLAASKKTGMKYTLNGTLPFYGAVTYNNQNAQKDKFEAAYDWAIGSRAEIIVIHSRFALHWLTVRPEGDPSNRRKYVGLADMPPPTTSESSQANFLAALDQSMRKLRNSKKTAVLVGALPFQGVNLNQCLSRPVYLMSVEHALRTCGGFSREEALARTREVNARMAEAAQKAGVIFIDPTELFCPDGQTQCQRIDDGKLVFRDTNHLSAHGATLLAAHVLERIEQEKDISFDVADAKLKDTKKQH